MLLVSVVVLALVAAAYTFVPSMKTGVKDLAEDVEYALRTGEIRGAKGNRGGQSRMASGPSNNGVFPAAPGTHDGANGGKIPDQIKDTLEDPDASVFDLLEAERQLQETPPAFLPGQIQLADTTTPADNYI
jgi:hypothetical protein